MTTTTTVAGRPLSAWTRDSRHGTWHATLPVRSGESALGALRVDRALLTPEGTRERLATAVLAVARLRLPGVLGTVDLVVEAGEVWLITARPPVPTLADLLARGGTGLDAGSAASVLNETAQSLLALHAAGLAHGALDTEAVVLAPDGVALLAEAALGTVLGDVPDAGRREADIAAWADLARTLGDAWTTAGTPAAALLARCSATARSKGLAAARAALVAGRSVLPAGFLRRAELRAAVAAATPEMSPEPGSDEMGADARRAPAAEEGREAADSAGAAGAGTGAAGTGTASTGAAGTGTASTGAAGADPENMPAEDAGALGASSEHAVPQVDKSRFTAPDEQLTMPGRARTNAVSNHSDITATGEDDQATLLGKRHRTPGGPPTVAPAGATASPPAGEDDEDDGEILLRFGPGIPVEAQDVLRAQWRTAPGPPPPPPGSRHPRRRRRRTRIATTAFLTAVAVLLWPLLRPSPAATVTAVEVRAPAGRLHCGQTADLVGVITTDGRGGPVTYHWLRSDGHDSGELVRAARRGQARITVHLRWTVRGPGSFRGTARLRIAQQRTLPEAEATFSYACS
ncbi:hypothetical protein ACFYXJ_15520 [Streptomyces sp. NPDC002667]|uniref:hypothetical protein n=1 Tax=Streptomyces sp. NPDC002667 TaxID=3364657 RepID=UPI00368D0177